MFSPSGQKIIEVAKDCLFPIFCLDCGKEGEWICPDCFGKMDLRGVFCCPVCHRPNGSGTCCAICQPQSCLDKAMAIAVYQEENSVGRLIKALKYNYAEDALAAFAKMIDGFLIHQLGVLSEVDLIVPVPLHRRRLVERGFNQARLLADILGQKIGRPVVEWLQRERYTMQQAKLSREERRANVHQAFANGDFKADAVLLADDVFTTGATMQECARVLKSSGVKKVIGFSVARG
ncbi:MAG: ComF family protein [Candidatus Magasanikbacteria bacterium]|nr:ComF family protein [Candidatus Magasanikbacteria bacterium]